MPKEKVISIEAPNIQSMKVRIVGTTPLCFHRWTEKAKKMILDKQMKKASKGREARNPDKEFLDSFYQDSEGRIAFPTLAVKQAVINSARNYDSVPMTLVRGAVFILALEDKRLAPVLYKGKPIKLSGEVKYFEEGEAPEGIKGFDPKNPDSVYMREDMVRIGMGTADIRFRGQVNDWTMELMVKFNADVFSMEQVINLLQTAGFSCGLGEWRTEKSGELGMFEVETV